MLNTPIKPMLLQPSTIIPKGEDYIHQIKLDGHRTLLHYDRGCNLNHIFAAAATIWFKKL